MNYYNEYDKFCAKWLNNLMDANICSNCNRMLGRAHDNPQKLARAVEYLNNPLDIFRK